MSPDLLRSVAAGGSAVYLCTRPVYLTRTSRLRVAFSFCSSRPSFSHLGLASQRPHGLFSLSCAFMVLANSDPLSLLSFSSELTQCRSLETCIST
jgi:hypothetical protein